MSALAEVCRIWFGVTLVATMVTLSVLTHCASLLSTVGLLAERTRQDVCVCIAALSFRTLLLCNPQIRVKQFDMDWDALLASAPSMILMNHASYFDFFLFTSILPLKVILSGHVRTVMSASLTKLPIVGKPIGDHAGSFKVYFQAKGAGFGKANEADFSVDRDKQQGETDRMKRHIEAERGILAFCPEGGMNKAPQDGLKPFRRGSFAQAAEFCTPIWGAALHGCTDAWPRDAKMGGYPCTVGVSLKLLTTPAAGATPADLAESSQAAMQLQVSELAVRSSGAKLHSQ